MACVNETGKLSGSAKRILETVGSEWMTPQEISKRTNIPLFKVRSGLRQMKDERLILENEGLYKRNV